MRRLLACLILGSTVLAACAPNGTTRAGDSVAERTGSAPTVSPSGSVSQASNAAASAAGGVHRGGTLRVMCLSAITSLDPATSKEADCDTYSYQLLYDMLVRTDDTGATQPDLATKWTIAPDGLTYTFTLQPGVPFQDGTALDAAAVKASLERTRDTPAAPGAIYLKVIQSIDAPDSSTVVLHLAQPSSALLTELGVPLTGSIVSPAAVKQYGQDFQRHPVGSGPFKLVSWTPGSAATFQRSPSYWQKGADGKALPYLDGVTLNSNADGTVRLLNLRSGQFDVDARIDPSDVQSVQANANLRLLTTVRATPYLVAMNVTKPPFNNKDLRLAVESAIDRASIIQNIGYGSGYQTPMSFAKGTWSFISDPSPVYDPSKAMQELAAAGYPQGATVHLSIINRTPDTQIAQIVQSNLSAVHITATIQALERTTWVNTWNARQGEIGLLQGSSTPTSPPDSSLTYFEPSNINDFGGYNNPQVVALIDQASRTVSQDQRKALFQQITEIVVGDAAYVWIGAVPVAVGVTSKVNGVDGSTQDASRAWLSS